MATDIQTEVVGLHKCLLIADIQALIFGSLTPKDCIQLAITCSSFYEEAVNVVWADVSSLVPFARCMPPDVMVETVTGGQRSLKRYSSSLVSFISLTHSEESRPQSQQTHFLPRIL